MRFSYHHSMCPPDQYLPLAIAAENLGFDGITVPDSICYPKHAKSKYPYNADGGREFLNDVPFLDPFLLIAHLSAVTSTLQFTTSVVKLAVRQPVIVAKQVTSLAVLTNNRFRFGVGVSPWQEDFEVTHIPWDRRGKRMDEAIDVVRGLMTGNDYYAYNGEIFEIAPIKLTPIPHQPVPIWIGGHSTAALKRAARLGDGWVCAGASTEQIKTMIASVNQFRKCYQRDHLPFEFAVAGPDTFSVDGIKRLSDIGVSEVALAFRNVYQQEHDNKSVDEKIDTMKWYADKVIDKFRQ